MPSRKKAQGRERKAKSKPIEASLQSNHPKASKSCSHGAPSNVPPVCSDFVDDFIRNFKKEEALTAEKLFETSKEICDFLDDFIEMCEKEEVHTTEKLHEATEQALLKHQQVAQDASLIGIVRSVHVSNGVSCALEGNFKHAEIFVTAALFLDTFSDFSSPATISNAGLKMTDLIVGNDRAVVKWLSKSTPCSCLKETLGILRKAKDKTRKCWGCNELVEISKLMACDGCKMAEYCSEDCQKAHWRINHKRMCLQLSEYKKCLDQRRVL